MRSTAHLYARACPALSLGGRLRHRGRAVTLAIPMERDGIEEVVLASDADAPWCVRPASGSFITTSISDTGEPDLHRWLIRHGWHWRPVPAERDRVSFSVAALGEDDLPRGCSLIFARNVWRH